MPLVSPQRAPLFWRILATGLHIDQTERVFNPHRLSGSPQRTNMLFIKDSSSIAKLTIRTWARARCTILHASHSSSDKEWNRINKKKGERKEEKTNSQLPSFQFISRSFENVLKLKWDRVIPVAGELTYIRWVNYVCIYFRVTWRARTTSAVCTQFRHTK